MEIEEKIKIWCNKNDFYYNIGGETTLTSRVYYLAPKFRMSCYTFYEIVVEEIIINSNALLDNITLLLNASNNIYNLKDLENYIGILQGIKAKVEDLKLFINI